MMRRQNGNASQSNTTPQNAESRESKNKARIAALWERPRILKGVDNYNVVIACRQVTPQIIKRLIALTLSTHGPTAVKACEIILNRAYGRAPVTVDVTHKLTADRALLEHAAAAILEKRRRQATAGAAALDTFDMPALPAAPAGASPTPPIAPVPPRGVGKG